MQETLRRLGGLVTLALGLAVAPARAADVPSGAVKWHPGLYVALPDPQPGAADVGAAVDEIANVPALRGLQIRYTWAELEPERGRYDFSRIERDLRLLAERKKRLWVLLQPKSFNPRQPALPDYLLREGGGFEFGAARGDGRANHNVALWQPLARDRLAALFAALGQRFDREPFFEGVAITETAYGKSRVPITPAMEHDFFENLLAVHRGLRAAFPGTVTLQFVNYPQRVLPWFVPGLAQAGAGLGGPDVFLEDPGLIDGIYRYYPQLAGTVPLAPSVQPEDYEQRRHGGPRGETPIDRLYAFGRDTLHANYLFWTRSRPGPGGPYQRFLDYLKSAGLATDESGGLATACPRAFKACVP